MEDEAPRRRRSLARDIADGARLDVVRIGHDRAAAHDLYHWLTRVGWLKFSTLFVALFLGVNAVFGALYNLDPDGLSVPPGDATPVFLRAFFFSVHTIATIGYGNVYPTDLFVNALVVIEITLGVLFFALASGLVFARFSIPKARILFSDKAVVTTFEGLPTLMLRAANQRENVILEANVSVWLLRSEVVNGKSMRRFQELALVRATSPFFSLSWTIMHKIDAASPLSGRDLSALFDADDELVVVVRGVDASVAQTIHGRQAYRPEDVFVDHDFVDVLSRDAEGRITIDYTVFHDIHPLGSKA